MKKIFSFIIPYRFYVLIALMLTLTELSVELLHPLFLSKVINEGIVREDLSAIWLWGGIMVGMSLLGFVAGIVNSFFAAKVSQGFGFDLRNYLFKRVQSYSYEVFNRIPVASLITRLTSDTMQLQNVVFMSLRIMLRSPLFMIGGLIMALMVHVKIALILLIAIPIIVGFLVWVMGRISVLFRKVQQQLDRTNSVLRENLMGIRLIKAFVRHRHEEEKFDAANDELMTRTIRSLRVIELTVPLILFAMNVCLVVIIWFGRDQVLAMQANVGDVVAIVNYTTRITASLSVVSMILMNLSRARASAQRLTEVIELEDHSEAGRQGNCKISRGAQGNIRFDQVSFRYPETTRMALSQLNFQIKGGSTVAIMGATGSGKSSLLQLIPKLFDVTEGTIYVDGQPLQKIEEKDLRQKISFVAQEAILFTGTVKENILWGTDAASDEQIIQAAKDAQIHDTIMSLPLQYESDVSQKAVNLSGGQKQRLSIARALIRKPKILILDDSTSALDLRTESKLLRALKGYQCTIVMVTQKISTAMTADQIILMDFGQVIATGTHAELYESSELYRQIVNSQQRQEGVSHA